MSNGRPLKRLARPVTMRLAPDVDDAIRLTSALRNQAYKAVVEDCIRAKLRLRHKLKLKTK